MTGAMSEEIMRNNLFVLAQRYADGHKHALTTVSKKIHGNQDFLGRFLQGEISVTLRMYFLMVSKMRQSWPKSTEWPKTVPVPRLGRAEYNPKADPLPRDGGGRFLGKKVHKVRRRL